MPPAPGRPIPEESSSADSNGLTRLPAQNLRTTCGQAPLCRPRRLFPGRGSAARLRPLAIGEVVPRRALDNAGLCVANNRLYPRLWLDEELSLHAHRLEPRGSMWNYPVILRLERVAIA